MTFVAICSAISHPFGYTSRKNNSPLDILRYLVTILKNYDNKVSLIIVNEDILPARYSKFMKTCHNMKIIVQNIGGYAS